jgi:hypothetical protein
VEFVLEIVVLLRARVLVPVVGAVV